MERLKQQGGSKQDQEALMVAHQKDVQTLVNKMDTDKLRMQSNLQERLRRRREDKMADKEREVYEQLEDSKREMAEKQRAETEKLMADEVKQRI